MKYNNTDSELLASLACLKSNLSIKYRLAESQNIDLLYKDDAGIFSAAITRNNHELLQMLLDYMEKSGQMEDEHERLCNVLSKIYDSEKYSVTKEIKSILYSYISDSMSFESFSEDNETKEDINAKIQEINDARAEDKRLSPHIPIEHPTADHSNANSSDEKKISSNEKHFIGGEASDPVEIITSSFEPLQEISLSGHIHINDANFDTL